METKKREADASGFLIYLEVITLSKDAQVFPGEVVYFLVRSRANEAGEKLW